MKNAHIFKNEGGTKMKRKFALLLLVSFLTVGLAGCDLLQQLFGGTTTTVETTTAVTGTTQTTESVTTTGSETTTEGTTTVTTTNAGEFVVTFYDYDGTTVLKSQVVASGASATPPADPSRPATDQYTFVFSGWSGSYTNVTGNVTVLATYTASIRQYTVSFYDEDGTTLLGTSTVNYGTAAVAPSNPTKASTAQYTYAFAAWSASFADVRSDFAVHATYTATIRQYTVTFYDDNGTTVLGTSTVNYGSPATPPASPVKADTAQWDYTFNGWDVSFSNVTSNLTVKATYVAALRSYDVTFLNADGTVIATQSVAYGSGAMAPANPTLPSSAQYDYVFTNWDRTFANITGPLTVNAVYSATVRNYDVTFVDADGTILKTESVAYGSGATAPADPSMASTAQYDFAFVGWDVAFDSIAGTLSVHAVYASTLRQYTVTFFDEDGVTVLAIRTVDYGSAAVPPADPSKAATATATYEFAGWNGEYADVRGNAAVYAVYTETRTAYVVAFYDADGTLLDTQYIALGGDAVAPADPFRAATAQFTFTFSGWDANYLAVASDLVITATYAEAVNSYTVTFFDEDGVTLLGTSTVDYGLPAVPPESPVKEGFFFVGWSQGVAFVTHDMEVVAVYSDVVWSRQLLLDYIASKYEGGTPTSEQIEADVALLLRILGTDSEYEAYRLTQVGEGFLAQVMNADTLAELQEAYANGKASGFDQDQIVAILMNAIEVLLEQQTTYGRYEDLLDQIAYLEQMIIDNEAMYLVIIQQGIDYCAAYADPAMYETCRDAWLALIEEENLYHAFTDAENGAWDLYGDAWDWDLMYALLWNLEDAYYYTYVDENPYYAALYMDAYLALYNGLTAEEQAMYDTVLLPFAQWKIYADENGGYARAMLGTILSGSAPDGIDGLYQLMDEYDQLFWDADMYAWQIVELQWQLGDAFLEKQFLLAVQTWFATETGRAEAETLAVTLYDVFESVLFGIDEGTFDLIYGLVTKSIDPSTIATDPASLDGYIGRAADLIRLLMSTVDNGDIENIKAVAKDLLGLYIGIQDFDETTEAELIALMELTVDDYADMAVTLYGQILVLLDSLDETKIDQLLDQIAILTGMDILKVEESADYSQIIAAATIVDILVYQSGVDIDFFVTSFVRIYYDVVYGMVYDGEEMLAVRDALATSVARIVQLTHYISALDPDAMPTAVQLQMIYELKNRIDALREAFGGGCPTMLIDADYSIYDHEMFLDLIYQLNGWSTSEEEAEAMIAMFVATFEMSEENTYFVLISILNAVRSMGETPSLTTARSIYDGLVATGFDNETIARYLTSFAVNMIDFKLAYPDTVDDIAYYQSLIDEYAVYVGDLEDDLDDLIAAVYAEIALHTDESVREAATIYFSTLLASTDQWRQYQGVYDAVRYSDEYYDLWDEDVYQALLYFEDQIFYYQCPLYYDDDELLTAISSFHSIWDSLSAAEQSMYAAPLNLYDVYATNYYDNVLPAEDILIHLEPTPMTSDGYQLLTNYLYWSAYDYANIVDEIDWMTRDIASWTNEIDYLETYVPETLLLFQAFLADAENRALVEQSILILLDDLSGTLAVLDTETIDLVISILSGYACPCELDLSAAGILGYTQQLSAILKSFGATITTEEFDVLFTLGMRLASIAVGQNTEWTDEQKGQILSMIETYVLKYVAIAGITRDDITDFLDSLTEEKIQIVLDQLAILGFSFDLIDIYDVVITPFSTEETEYSELDYAVAIATIIDTLFYDGSLDTDSLIATVLEVYYDFVYDGEVDPLVKAAVVTAFQEQIDQLILIAHEIAGMDPSALSPDDIALLMEAKQRIEFLGSVFESADPEAILEPVTFGYERWMFIDLLWNIDWSVDWNNDVIAEAAIATVTEILDTTEEEAYFDLMAIMNVARQAMESGDPEAVLAAIDQLSAIGFTDEQIATYLGNLPLAVLSFEQFMNSYGYSENPYEWDLYDAQENLLNQQAALEEALMYAQWEVDDWTQQLADLENTAAENIAALTNETARNAAQTFWDEKTSNNEAYLAYYWAFDLATMDPSWDYDIFYDLQYDLSNSIYYVSSSATADGYYDAMTAMNYANSYQSAFNSLSEEEQALYGSVLSLYQACYSQNVNELYDAEADFWDAYYSAVFEDQLRLEAVYNAAANHWYVLEGLHAAEAYLAEIPGMYESCIQDAEDYLAQIQALYDAYGPEDFSVFIEFFSDPVNAANWDIIAAALVEEAGNLLDNMSPELLNLIVSFTEYQDATGQLQYYLSYYEDLMSSIDSIQADMAEALANLAVAPDAQAYAAAWWDANVVYYDGWLVYIELLDSTWNLPGFDSGTYFYLENILANALMYEGINYYDESWATYYRGLLDEELSWLTPEESALYIPILEAYESYTSWYWNEWTLAEIDFFNYCDVIWYNIDEVDYDFWMNVEFWYNQMNSLTNMYAGAIQTLHNNQWVLTEIENLEAKIPTLLDLTPEGLAGYAHMVGAYLGIVFDTLDVTDRNAIVEFAYAGMELYFGLQGLTETEIADLMAYNDGLPEFYLDALIYAPNMVSQILLSLSGYDVQTILDAIETINALDGVDPDLDNMIRAVAMADIIMAVDGEGTVDTNYIVETAVWLYFDATYELNYQGDIIVSDRIIYLQTLVDSIILQADVIDGYDPYGLTEEERGDINDFHLLIEELMPYLQYGFDYVPEP
jgi:hypothetical protein